MRTLVSLLTPDFVPGAVALLASMRANSGLDPARPWLFWCWGGQIFDDLQALWPGAEMRDAAELGEPPVAKGLAMPRHQECMRRVQLLGAPCGPLVNIDCDMLCLGSLDGIDDLPAFGAALDHGINRSRGAVNTGLLVVDPDQGDLAAVREVCETFGNLPLADQSAINVWLHRNPGRLATLPDEWNTLKRVYHHRPDEWRQDAIRLLHFVGLKPWQPQPESGVESHYQPLVDIWRGYHRLGADAV